VRGGVRSSAGAQSCRSRGPSSTLIAGRVYAILGVPHTIESELDFPELEEASANGQDSDPVARAEGTLLEEGLETDLRRQLNELDGNRKWDVNRTKLAYKFAQYEHLRKLKDLLDVITERFDDDQDIRALIGTDYAVKTDVMIGLPDPAGRGGADVLHAAVSSKLTLRSDRAQNVRTEFNVLVKNRPGRLPHLVVVTAEPLPGRLISLTRGTGEIDAVYRLLFEEMDEAINQLVTEDRPRAAHDALQAQQVLWREMISGSRMRPYSDLASVLARG
jgi:hypothetical protein